MKKILLILFLFLISCSNLEKITKLEKIDNLTYEKIKTNKIVYLAIWCPFCQEIIDDIVKNNEKNTIIIFYPYNKKGVKNNKEILKYVLEKKIKNRVFIDENLEIMNKLDIKSVPKIIEN